MFIKSKADLDKDMKEMLAIKCKQDEIFIKYGTYDPPKIKKKKRKKSWSREFQKSEEWAALKNKYFETANMKCSYCGATDNLQVDHIKPKSKYKHLALEISNLQILCWPCNSRKSAREV